jgi:hypothetical protein
MSPPPAPPLRWLPPLVALAGLAGLLAALTTALAPGPAPEWLWRFFAGWCVATPYWWYLEHRFLFVPKGPERWRQQEQQAISQKVWLGGALALAVLLLRPR